MGDCATDGVLKERFDIASHSVGGHSAGLFPSIAAEEDALLRIELVCEAGSIGSRGELIEGSERWDEMSGESKGLSQLAVWGSPTAIALSGGGLEDEPETAGPGESRQKSAARKSRSMFISSAAGKLASDGERRV